MLGKCPNEYKGHACRKCYNCTHVEAFRIYTRNRKEKSFRISATVYNSQEAGHLMFELAYKGKDVRLNVKHERYDPYA